MGDPLVDGADEHDPKATPRRDIIRQWDHRRPASTESPLERPIGRGTASPAATVMSITPKGVGKTRLASSVTPTALAFQRSLTFDTPESPLAAIPVDDSSEQEHEDWGEDAVMSWGGDRRRSGQEDALSVQDTEDASSVNAEEAGLIGSDDEDDDDAGELSDDEVDEDEWGRDAMLEWDHEPGMEAVSISGASDTELSEADDEGEDEQDETVDVTEELGDSDWDEGSRGAHSSRSRGGLTESKEDLMARGMPDYDSWDVKKLQKLCGSYGYRPSTKHAALVGIAMTCWLALNPPPADESTRPTKKPARAPPMPAPSGSTSSITSAEVPLADIKSRKKGPSKAAAGSAAEGTSRSKAKKKSRVAEEGDSHPVEAPPEPLDLKKAFHDLIKADVELYLRILRYEVSQRSWKPYGGRCAG